MFRSFETPPVSIHASVKDATYQRPWYEYVQKFQSTHL